MKIGIEAEQETNEIDTAINTVTQHIILQVAKAKGFNIMTACLINGEVVIISEYDIPSNLEKELENAILNYDYLAINKFFKRN